MTDEEYAAEWPFTLTLEEIKLCRTLAGRLNRNERDIRGKLIQRRVNIEFWLGGYFNPDHSRAKHFLWNLVLRRVYDLFRTKYRG